MASTADKAIWDERRLADPHRQPDKARRVQAMFDRIAPTYERVNRVLSAGRDGYWRRRAVELARIHGDDRVLDIACGTGDLSRAFASAGPHHVVGSDFSAEMLTLAAARRAPRVSWCKADALTLPFSDGAFTVAGCAFGIRNLQDLPRGLEELRRVLTSGGRLVILEFGVPTFPPIRAAYLLYFRHVMPRAARLISGDRSGAYDYLPQSVTSFLDEKGMIAALRSAGFARVEARRLTFGVVTVYIAWK